MKEEPTPPKIRIEKDESAIVGIAMFGGGLAAAFLIVAILLSK